MSWIRSAVALVNRLDPNNASGSRACASQRPPPPFGTSPTATTNNLDVIQPWNDRFIPSYFVIPSHTLTCCKKTSVTGAQNISECSYAVQRLISWTVCIHTSVTLKICNKLEHLSLQTRYVGGMPLPFEGSHLGPPSAKAKTSWSGHPTVAALRRATLVSEQNVVNLFLTSVIHLFVYS